MKLTKLKTNLALGLTGLGLTAGSASAATTLIDWSIATTISSPAGDGKHWNSLGQNGTTATDITATSLIDSVTGLDSGIDVAVNIDPELVGGGGVRGASFGGNGINGPAGADPFDEAGAVIDGIFVSTLSGGGTTSAIVTLSDLAASTQYDLILIGGRASNGEDGVIEVLQGSSGLSTYNLLNDGTLLSFSVTSTAGGIIELDFSKSTSSSTNGATWNALSISNSVVPEPSTTALLGLGGLAFILRRRK